MTDITGRFSTAIADRYAIRRLLGQGGMATVYLADDLKHDRQVAIKVLRPELAAVLGAERFVQEIKTTAQLQHPNILPLFDSGRTGKGAGGPADVFLYYVMPYVEGETLRDKLNREKQLGVEEAIRITTEVAGALDYAHRHGVIHRDIKPENILLHDGRALVADFGIALAVSAAAGGRMTETGLSLGTPHYMSPEQATAEKTITNRSDVYSLGAVLYEMLTGEPPHTGSSAQQIIMKIVTEDPRPVEELRKSVPPNVAAAIRQALQKLPADRFASATAFAEALANVTFAGPAHAPGMRGVAAPRRRLDRVTATLAVAAVVLTATTAWGWLRATAGPPRSPERLDVLLPPGAQPFTYVWNSPVAISPDGQTLAYTASQGGVSRLYVRGLGDFEPHAVTGTEGAHSPFFSPDGRWVGFLTRNKLWKVSVSGGPPVLLCEVLDERLGAAWGTDGTIVFADNPGLMRVDAAGGTPELLRPLRTDSGETALAFPQVLPDGAILFNVLGSPTSGPSGEVFEPETGASRVVLKRGIGMRYLPGGYLLYTDLGVLQVARFDLRHRAVTSSPIPVAEHLHSTMIGNSLFSVSAGGTLVYLPASAPMRVAIASGPGTLVRVGADGRETTLWRDWPGESAPRLSPSGGQVAAHVAAGPTDPESNFNVWVFDLERHTQQKLTTEGTNLYPLWSPDGRRVSFSSSRAGPMNLFWTPADGSGKAAPLLTRPGEQFGSSWSPDGRFLAYFTRDPKTIFDIWVLPLDGRHTPQPFLRTPANETGLAFSPDGHWAAYASDESGRFEVYVRPFPGPGAPAIVSTAGGRAPRWALDGNTLYYQHGGGLWAAPVRTRPVLHIGEPKLLFEGPYAPGYDIDPKGRGFVMVRLDPPAEQSRFDVVLNWFTELDRLVQAQH